MSERQRKDTYAASMQVCTFRLAASRATLTAEGRVSQYWEETSCSGMTGTYTHLGCGFLGVFFALGLGFSPPRLATCGIIFFFFLVASVAKIGSSSSDELPASFAPATSNSARSCSFCKLLSQKAFVSDITKQPNVTKQQDKILMTINLPCKTI